MSKEASQVPVLNVGLGPIDRALQLVLTDTLAGQYQVRVTRESLPGLLAIYVSAGSNSVTGSLVVTVDASYGEQLYAFLLLVTHTLLGHTASPYSVLLMPRYAPEGPLRSLQGKDLQRHAEAMSCLKEFLDYRMGTECEWGCIDPALCVGCHRYLVNHIRRCFPGDFVLDTRSFCGDLSGQVSFGLDLLWSQLVSEMGDLLWMRSEEQQQMTLVPIGDMF